MIFSLFCQILFNPYIFYGALLPAIVAFGIKFKIKKARGKLDVTNEVDISGKLVVVTGASDGIGKVTAEQLAVRGAKVVMACRNLQKAQKVVDDIRSRTQNGELIIMHLDLSSLSSVRKFASDFTSKYGGPSSPGLSMLINNAGVANAVGIRSLTKDGFEEAFGVNHLAHFLLTNLLLPEIERAGALSTADNPARVIIVSSGVHVWGKLNFDDLMYEKTPLNEYLFPSKLYCNSKLANALFNVELARRLRAKKVKVTSNALDPGLVGTNFGKDHPRKFFVRNVIFPILSFFQMKSAREGAETTLHCALSKYLAYHSGEMYRDCQFWDYTQRPKLTEKDAALLWEKSEKFIKLTSA
ncbi:retinol dehydrogenase 12 [Folsomia candida]|uniref:Retinol dehydrogenase 12 n=1 Tax=Folsomia candida TaxID=158441 RepID=A0A226DMA7_FOLCA|nr:retinol dehydrogenase 12 [Folsomia candida]OXA46260.1 Retinol dehydrogenase 12 [Folsomia candida]